MFATVSSWSVCRIDPAFGPGKYLGRVRAITRQAAEQLARERFGPNILVTIAGGRARRKTA